ncbi:MAG: serine/threonine protein kinase [Polyangiaceae bacterium]|nr:serine/threonine protein kinase [Polyangiaceae bacterium]
MLRRPNPVEALLALPRLQQAEERRTAFRQTIAALGATTRLAGPPPLDDVDAEQLRRAITVALATGLCDELDWITPGKAAVALFMLSSALPAGKERRELARRVFARLYEGSAETFAAVAARMALGNARPLEAATIRARVSLVMDMPVGSPINADPLALAIASRRELTSEWIGATSTGALPARRLAARLLEHAAQEALIMAQQGDQQPRRVLVNSLNRPALERLLADREPLVWRHAAVARGLLATLDSRLHGEIEHGLDPGLNPTAWRRAAVSLVAATVADPAAGLKHCHGLLEGVIAERDPGIVATMVWGIPRLIEAEPDAAEELLADLAARGRPDVAEAVAELLADLVNPSFATTTVDRLRNELETRTHAEHPVLRALTEQALRQLARTHERGSVHAHIMRAVQAFETTGAREAHEQALAAVQAAQREVIEIAAFDPEDEATLPELLTRLSDIDAATLESSRLTNLLLLGRRPGDTDTSVPEMERMFDSIGTWALDAEEAVDEAAEWTQIRTLGRQRRLRTILHLVDSETARHADSDIGSGRVRVRLRRAIEVLLDRLASGPDGAIHRILSAALARSCDAAVREGLADPSDVFLLVAHTITDHETIAAMAEASTNPDVHGPLVALHRFLEGATTEPLEEDLAAGASLRASFGEDNHVDPSQRARSVLVLSNALGASGSHRGEALRQVVFSLGRALETVANARGLSDLEETRRAGTSTIGEVEAACEGLRRLVSGARRRVLGADVSIEIDVMTDVAPLSSLIERATSGVPPNPEQIAMAMSELVADLPTGFASAVWTVMGRIATLPVHATSDVFAIPLGKRRPTLPDWLLPRRTVGAFYVVRALGAGGVSSVFEARRYEERNDKHAESFALKVPQYDPTTARKLSEQEFMQLFRDEAGALLSLPQHSNLARFVTFDLAARPRPILVMELIDGTPLDRLIRSRSLTMASVLEYLDGVLAGLEAMHGVEVGHLDLKPSNVIVRDDGTPVLVDFGLSGRQLRPGCGTLEYVAPEVLGLVPRGHQPSPAGADLYSFACMAFELLTTNLLFDAEDELQIMSHHVAHDGWPPKLAALASNPGVEDLMVVLAACLRRDPRNRPDVATTRQALQSLRGLVESVVWPLSPAPAAAVG